MTDHIPADKLAQAREWAEVVTARMSDLTTTRGHTAAEVINALPEEWVDAKELRKVIDGREGREITYDAHLLYREVEALLPAPTPRTLADMAEEERAECQWMQATFTKSSHEHIITQVFGKKARLLRRADGAMFEVYHDEVTPLPDLPRLEWPTCEPSTEDTPEPAPAKLVTVEDYHNAPEDTVVWGKGPSFGMDSALQKHGNAWIEAGDDGTFTPRDMERNGPHVVLRRGDVS